MKNRARPRPPRTRRLTNRRGRLCPRPTHRKPPVHPYQKRMAKLRRLHWTQATAIGIPLRSPLQPLSVSTAVARKEAIGPVKVGAPQHRGTRLPGPPRLFEASKEKRRRCGGRFRVHENFSGQREKRCFAGKGRLPLSDRPQAIPNAVASPRKNENK
jgi:hypothetical protein